VLNVKQIFGLNMFLVSQLSVNFEISPFWNFGPI